MSVAYAVITPRCIVEQSTFSPLIPTRSPYFLVKALSFLVSQANESTAQVSFSHHGYWLQSTLKEIGCLQLFEEGFFHGK